jgi:hypothetical protein
LFNSFLSGNISRVRDPSEGLKENGRSKVILISTLTPPVRRARSAAAGAQDAFIETVQLLSLFGTLENFSVFVWVIIWVVVKALPGRFHLFGSQFEPRSNSFVLLIKSREIRNKISHHVHVRERIDGHFAFFGGIFDFLETSKSVGSWKLLDFLFKNEKKKKDWDWPYHRYSWRSFHKFLLGRIVEKLKFHPFHF